VRTRTYLLDRNDWEAVGSVHGEIFGAVRPASTMVVVAGLLDPRWRLEVEAEAVIDPDPGLPEDAGGEVAASQSGAHTR
jgi:enamine deaminase RidA (YjgF/YER057c/UK114 family)